MRTAALFTAGATLLSLANARIYGFAAPSTIKPDSTIKLEIEAENYIQTIQDVAISFGIQPSASAHDETLGNLLSSKYLGPDESNVVGNITHYVHVPATQPLGETTLTAALFSLIGASLSGNVEYFSVKVLVGNETSSTYVSSS